MRLLAGVAVGLALARALDARYRTPSEFEVWKMLVVAGAELLAECQRYADELPIEVVLEANDFLALLQEHVEVS